MGLALHSEQLREAGFRHAFFTRRGGVSRPPYESLNFSVTVGDDPTAVGRNLRRAAAHLGVRPGNVHFLNQVHGCEHHVLASVERQSELPHQRGDITLSSEATVACAVRTADCPAVLVADRHSGAVAAIHAGWRGTVRGVVSAAIKALSQLTGRSLDAIAAIGPHIEQCCFEVGDDVASQLAQASELGHEAIERHQAKAHVDLRRILTAQLISCGLPAAEIDQVRGCTVCDIRQFHSYRRDGPRSGRMLAAIVARPDSA